eukprot:gene28346-14461_t
MGDADRPSALELSLKDASHAENFQDDTMFTPRQASTGEIRSDDGSFNVAPPQRKKRRRMHEFSPASPFKKRHLNGQAALRHNFGKYTFQVIKKGQSCIACKQKDPPVTIWVKSGCIGCKIRRGACGIRVCARCWNEPAVKRWHKSGWRK